MTNSPITPPPTLVKQWVTEVWHEGTPARLSLSDMHIATEAARWGSDMELEACCAWLERNLDDWDNLFSAELRAARRPKPPSLKEQALKALDQAGKGLNESEWQQCSGTIRRALEQLDD